MDSKRTFLFLSGWERVYNGGMSEQIAQTIQTGSGATAIGAHSQAVGAAGVLIGGSSYGDITTNVAIQGASEALLQKIYAELNRPEIGDLFEIIDDPQQLLPTLFDDVAQFASPYRTDYRETVWQLSPKHLLRPLLLTGVRGMGRTREVAAFARRLCAERGWTIYIAKPTKSQRMGEVAGVPVDRKILLIVEEIGRYSPTYLDRLNALIRQLQKDPQLTLAVIATTTASAAETGWETVALPNFSTAGLTRFLEDVAAVAGLAITTASAELVTRSDGTPKTIIENVRHAQRTGGEIGLTGWEMSWRTLLSDRFLQLYQQTKGRIVAVFQWMQVLAAADLPAHHAYLQELLGVENTDVLERAVALQTLFVTGEIYHPYDVDQLENSLTEFDEPLLPLTDCVPAILAAVLAVGKREPQRLQADGLDFAEWLFDAGYSAETITLLSALIGLDSAAARPYQLRGLAHWQRQQYPAALADLSHALALDDTPQTHLLRALVSISAGEIAAAIADATAAIEASETLGYALRAYAQQAAGDYAAAEGDLSHVLSVDPHDSHARRARAMVYYAQQ